MSELCKINKTCTCKCTSEELAKNSFFGVFRATGITTFMVTTDQERSRFIFFQGQGIKNLWNSGRIFYQSQRVVF